MASTISTSDLAQFQYVSRSIGVSDNVKQRQVRFQPMTSYGISGSSPADYVTFNFKTDGYWDPLSTYINIEVDCDSIPAHTVYQLDNSAQTLIGQYIARINGVELLRIREYDEMAAFIYDLNLGSDARDARAGEGIGRNKTNSNASTNKNSSGGLHTQIFSATEFGTTIPAWGTAFTHTAEVNLNFSMNCAGHRPWAFWQGIDPDTSAQLTSRMPGALQSYLEEFSADDSQGLDIIDYDNGSNYATSNFGGYYLKTREFGMPRPNTEASVGTGEYYMSPYCHKPSIQSGLPCSMISTKANFQFPLLCPIFGALATHGKLLPMDLFNSLEFEFLINPYAFFVGGTTSDTLPLYYKDQASTNSTIGNWNNSFTMKSRIGWKITRFEISTELFYPPPSDDSLIKARINNSGFGLNFKNWYLGPKLKMENGNSMNSTIQINNGFDSLNLLAFYFQPDDYENYTYARKHKRVSNNLTSMQLRIGSEYIPSIPITGHAGNIRPSSTSLSTSLVSSYGKTNYVDFYVNTMKAFGKWLQMGGEGIINPTNYCLNHVGYDPSYDITGNTSLRSLSFDMSLYWENQCVPRNIFAFDLERFDIINNLQSGTNTTKLRPFDLLLTNDNSSFVVPRGGCPNPEVTTIVPTYTAASTAYPRGLNLYIWLYYDAMIEWSSLGGWKVTGRV